MNIATTRLDEFFIFFSGLSTASMKAGELYDNIMNGLSDAGLTEDEGEKFLDFLDEIGVALYRYNPYNRERRYERNFTERGLLTLIDGWRNKDKEKLKAILCKEPGSSKNRPYYKALSVLNIK